jgi:dynein heavy chain
MNTVLDDNKKLCLTSGEIIALTPQMRMMFEVEDLSVASPATVSRCGMVYMEPSALGLEPLIQSWCERLPSTFKKEYVEQLKKLMLAYTTISVRLVRKKLKEISSTVDNNLALSHFRLLDCYFNKFIPTEAKTPSKDEIEKLGAHLNPLFLFTLVWSVGATCDNKSRGKFNEFLWDQVKKQNLTTYGDMKEGESWYDYMYSIEGEFEGSWVPWLKTIPTYQVPRASEYQNIVVPTVDSIRMTKVLSTLVLQQKHVIIAGNTGTGKSCYVSLWIQKDAPDNYLGIFVNFSAQTSVNQFQDLLDGKFEKRRRGVYGPPAGKCNVIFVDDLNMPKKEYYGAQPPIELIRQWHDYKGWYNRKELKCNEVIDIVHVSAMGPPGGGRTAITERLKRHYNTVVAADLSRESTSTIFSTILSYFLQQFEEPVKALESKMVNGAIDFFDRAQEELLPTPAKQHYLFNLRDIWRVFQGVCGLPGKKVSDPVVAVRCWCHENLRVYGDRLINTKDRDWFRENISKLITECFQLQVANVLDKERLIFADFVGGDAKMYMEVEDMSKMKTGIENFLDDYNNMSRVQMPLVMFLDACEHVARICRILRQPNGNALLLGVGGSGRQSLSRLSSFISEYDTFQIEVVKGYGMNEFKDDLKGCLLKCGNEAKM